MNTLNMDAHYARQVEEQQEEETMDRQLSGNVYISDNIWTHGEECDACNPGADAAGNRRGAPAIYRLYIKVGSTNWGAGKFCHICLSRIVEGLTDVLEQREEEMAQVKKEEAEDAYWLNNIIVLSEPES